MIRRFFAVRLAGDSRARSVRLALYQHEPAGFLDAIWDSHDKHTGAKWPHMVTTERDSLPTRHFKVTPGSEHGGMTSSRTEAACEALACAIRDRLRCDVLIQLLEGWQTPVMVARKGPHVGSLIRHNYLT